MCAEHFRAAHALANLIVGAREIRERTVPPCFLAASQTSSGSRVRLHSGRHRISPRENMDVLSSRCFSALFSSSLSLLSFVGLSTCSHLRFWNYFISIRYRLLRISTRPVYRPLSLSKFRTVLPSCSEWTYPTSICPDPQCYNHQSAVLKSTIITSKYFINIINILF